MGFRTGAYAMVWSVEPKTDTWTKARISISRKNKTTEEFEQDFSGFVDFSGTASAKKAAALKPESRIKLGDVDVTNIPVLIWDQFEMKHKPLENYLEIQNY